MKGWRSLDYPKFGKILLLLMAATEASAYLYLAITSPSEGAAVALSLYLLFTALTTVTLAAISIPPKVYYYHSNVFLFLSTIAIAVRIGSLIILHRLNDSPSEEFYLTEDGYVSFMQTALVFAALNCLLLYEKTHYYRTKKSDD